MNTSIGENIKIMRRKCGFTQEELALRLGVTPQAVSKWENGGGTPDISQLIPLSQIFGITTDSLLGVVSATYGSAHTEAALGHEKLLNVTAKEFFFSFEDFAWFTDSNEALEYGAKVLTIIDAYKAFDHLIPAVLRYENMIRSFLPRCYAAINEIDKAANELITIANNGVAIAAANCQNPGSIEEIKADTLRTINNAITNVDKSCRDKVAAHSDYQKAIQIAESIC